jgi:hypothetical protein
LFIPSWRSRHVEAQVPEQLNGILSSARFTVVSDTATQLKHEGLDCFALLVNFAELTEGFSTGRDRTSFVGGVDII